MNKSNRYKIGRRLPLIVFLLFALYAGSQTRQLEQYYKQITQVNVPRNEAALKMENMLVAIGCETKSYLKNGQRRSIDEIDKCKLEFREYQKIYNSLVDSKSEAIIAASMDKTYAVMNNTVEELLNIQNIQFQKEVLLDNNFTVLQDILEEAFKAHSKPDEKDWHIMLDAIMHIGRSVDNVRRNLQAYLRLNDAKYEIKIYGHQNELKDLLGQFAKLHNCKEHSEWFDNFKNTYDENVVLIQEIVAVEKRKNQRSDEFNKLQERLNVTLDSNQHKAKSQLDSIKYSGDQFLRSYTFVNPVLALFGAVIILLSQIYSVIIDQYGVSKSDDKRVQTIDTEIHIPPPNDSQNLEGSFRAEPPQS